MRPRPGRGWTSAYPACFAAVCGIWHSVDDFGSGPYRKAGRRARKLRQGGSPRPAGPMCRAAKAEAKHWLRFLSACQKRTSKEPLGLRGQAQIRFERPESLWEALLCVFVADRCDDDHVLARFPIHRCCDWMLCGNLQRVEKTQHFVEIAPARHWISQHSFDLFVWPDDEDGADGRIVGRRAAFGAFARVGREHVVKLGDLELRISDHRVSDRRALRLFDVLDPARMR